MLCIHLSRQTTDRVAHSLGIVLAGCLIGLGAVVAFFAMGDAGSAAQFQGLGFMAGGTNSYASGVSADGSVIVGKSNTGAANQPTRWTQATGMVSLGFLPDGYNAWASGVSADGSVVVGGNIGATNGAFRWTASGGMVAIGGGATGYAAGVSSDGSVVVGAMDHNAFRWTASGGMVNLGHAPGDAGSKGGAVSADGSVVVGVSIGPLDPAMGSWPQQAFRWTAAAGMLGLGNLPGGKWDALAQGVSADGSVVVGYSESNNGPKEAFRWTASSGMVGLGFLGTQPGAFVSEAYGTSLDGSVVVGYSYLSDVTDSVGFVWDKLRGMQNLRDLLVNEFGLTNLTGWLLNNATAISADGQTIVGNARDPSGHSQAWCVNLDGVTRSWAGTSDTSWDQPGNWSKWGKPGPQTTVVINPDNAYTVAGPAATASVLSLTLGTHLSGTAQLTLSGPSLSVQNALTIQPRGQLQHNAGALSAGSLQNNGVLNQALGTSLSVGTMVNAGTATFDGVVTPTTSIENQNVMNIQAEATVGTGTSGLTNVGTLVLDGGSIAGSGQVLNDGSGLFTARGTIAAPLLNIGVLNLSGTLAVQQVATNWGQIGIGSGHIYRAGAMLTNSGIIDLGGGTIASIPGMETFGTFINSSGGLVKGPGSISAATTNSGGLIYANDGLLALTRLTGNMVGGELRVGPTGTLNAIGSFSSSGLITLEGPGARFGGGTINNSGTIVGCGQVSNTVQNSGIIRAENGQLTLSGAANTNTSGGQIQVPFGSTLFLSQGLTTNSGNIALMGGTFDTNNTAMTNGGTLAGNGTIRTRSLSNSGQIKIADANTAFYGPVTNTGSVTITENTTTFYGYVTNNGTIKTTSAMVRYLGGASIGGTYISDPSTQYFEDLIVGANGVLVGGLGDKFIVGGKFLNASTQNTAWNTDLAELDLSAGVSHLMDLPGAAKGALAAGYLDNFSWGTLSLASGASLVLQDGNASPGGALYVHELLLAGGLAQIANITGNGFDLYYDSSKAANAYLLAQRYSLAGGGVLAPVNVPEPGTLALLATGLLGLLAYAWRRRRS